MVHVKIKLKSPNQKKNTSPRRLICMVGAHNNEWCINSTSISLHQFDHTTTLRSALLRM